VCPRRDSRHSRGRGGGPCGRHRVGSPVGLARSPEYTEWYASSSTQEERATPLTTMVIAIQRDTGRLAQTERPSGPGQARGTGPGTACPAPRGRASAGPVTSGCRAQQNSTETGTTRRAAGCGPRRGMLAAARRPFSRAWSSPPFFLPVGSPALGFLPSLLLFFFFFFFSSLPRILSSLSSLHPSPR